MKRTDIFFRQIQKAYHTIQEYNSKKNMRLLVTAQLIFLMVLVFGNVYQPYILAQIYQALGEGKLPALYQACVWCSVLTLLYFLLAYLNNTYADFWWQKAELNCSRGFCRKLHTQSFDRLTKRFLDEEMVNRIDASATDFSGMTADMVEVAANTLSVLYLFSMFTSFSYVLVLMAAILAVWSAGAARVRLRIQKKYETKRQKIEDCRGGLLRDSIYGIDFASMFGCSERMQEHYRESRDSAWETVWKQSRASALLAASTTLVTSSLRGLFGASMFPSYKNGRMLAEDVSSSFSVYDELGGVVNSYASPFVNIQERQIRIGRMEEMYEGEGECWSDGEPGRRNLLIEAENISFVIKEKAILKNVSVSIGQGEKIALIGRNGCGKSTLLRVLAGLYEPQGGSLKRDKAFLSNHRSISYIPSATQLYEDTAEENIRMNGDGNLREIYASPWMYGQGEDFSGQTAGTLSGGQAQRVNIARGLAHRAPLLLADEPEAGLPSEQGEQVIKSLVDGADTVVVITHYPSHLAYFTRIILMEDGEIAASGSLSEISTHPAYLRWSGEMKEKTGIGQEATEVKET